MLGALILKYWRKNYHIGTGCETGQSHRDYSKLLLYPILWNWTVTATGFVVPFCGCYYYRYFCNETTCSTSLVLWKEEKGRN